eukprot:7375884-Prymnesium_polylepis.2
MDGGMKESARGSRLIFDTSIGENEIGWQCCTCRISGLDKFAVTPRISPAVSLLGDFLSLSTSPSATSPLPPHGGGTHYNMRSIT